MCNGALLPTVGSTGRRGPEEVPGYGPELVGLGGEQHRRTFLARVRGVRERICEPVAAGEVDIAPVPQMMTSCLIWCS